MATAVVPLAAVLATAIAATGAIATPPGDAAGTAEQSDQHVQSDSSQATARPTPFPAANEPDVTHNANDRTPWFADGIADESVEEEEPAPAARPLVPLTHCRVYPHVRMPDHVRPALAAICKDFFEKTGRSPRVTSGTRTADEQAWQMFDRLDRGKNVVRIYSNKRAASQIRNAFRKARKNKLGDYGTVAAMTEVIERQIRGGVYISNHLRSGAIDVGARDLTKSQRRTFAKIARRHGVRVLDETRTRRPHFHLTFR